MRRIRISVTYDGSGFHGWQVQPGTATIQRALETVLGQLEGAPVSVAGSGRTDAGVHALAQVAAFSLSNPIPVENLRKAMNQLLPPDIRVTEAAEVESDFHPRFQAKSKTYEYRIQRAALCSPFERRFVHHYPYVLDDARFIAMAPLLEGEQDFTAFAASDPRDHLGHSKVRNILLSLAYRRGNLLIYQVTGSGFLKHMVRNIVGVLLEAGKGNLGADEIRARLVPGCGIPAGPTAPASGLFLVSVEYAKIPEPRPLPDV